MAPYLKFVLLGLGLARRGSPAAASSAAAEGAQPLGQPAPGRQVGPRCRDPTGLRYGSEYPEILAQDVLSCGAALPGYRTVNDADTGERACLHRPFDGHRPARACVAGGAT